MILDASPAERRELGARPRTPFPSDRFDEADATSLRRLFAATLAGPGVRPAVTVRVRADDGQLRMREVAMTDMTDDPAAAGVGVGSRDVTAPSTAHARFESGVDPQPSETAESVLGLPLFSVGEPPERSDWMVMLEAAAGLDATWCDRGAFRTMLSVLEDCRPTGLSHPDRYALQLTVVAGTLTTALVRALDR